MITAGVDSGIEYVKAVVLRDGVVLSRSIARSGGGDRARSAEQVWEQAVHLAGLTPADISRTVATGQGKNAVKFASSQVVEPVADVRAARFLHPSVRSVADIGADQCRIVTLGPGGKIIEVVINLKCAAGLGIFLRSTARRLGITLPEMSGSPEEPTGLVTVSDTCCVFGTLDVTALIHNNTPKPVIIAAVNAAVATRINSVFNDKIPPDTQQTVVGGGVALNLGVMAALHRRAAIDFIIPEYPEFLGALGAALSAAG